MTTDATNASPDISSYLNLANYVYNSGNVPSLSTTGTPFVPLVGPDGKPVEQIDYQNGFYGQAFINNTTSQPQLVIAFEGTNLHSSPESSSFPAHTFFNAQVVDDGDIFYGVNPPAQGTSSTSAFADALNFTQSAISTAEADDHVSAGNIFLDGHSLGGAEAEYVSSQLDLPGATFGAPGIPASNFKSGDTGANSGLTDYVDYGDPVGNYYTGSVLGKIVIAPNSQHYGVPVSEGQVGNDVYLNRALKDYPNNAGVALNFAEGFLHYHVLKNYASDFNQTLVSDDNTTGTIGQYTQFFAPLQTFGSSGPGECFVAGTRLMTPQGERAIEAIATGDVLVTAAGTATVIWVGRRRLDVAAHPRPAEVLPIRVAAHAFAADVPARDLYVSPGHGIAIDGALIPARLLANGTSIAQVEVALVDYWHVELARHDLVLAEGLATESYMDCGNRAAFEGQVGAQALHPSFAPALSAYASMEDSCLPWIVAGPALVAACAKLAARAQENAARGGVLSRLSRRAA